MQLVFATQNPNKLSEARKLMPEAIDLVSLPEIGCAEEIAETGDTLEENARIKANYVLQNYRRPCFAEDTGLIVDALDGAPGVHTARYAGIRASADENMDKLLRALEGHGHRAARFETVIALCTERDCRLFKGAVYGTISHTKIGTRGFGYDPIFKPEGFQKTFAELPLSVKNEIGHRGKAIQALLQHLKTHWHVIQG